MKTLQYLFTVVFTSLFFVSVSSRKHQLVLDNDVRSYFRISTFGFLKGGKLEVKLNHLTFYSKYDAKLGLTLTKTISDSISPYMESQQNKCFLADDALTTDGNIQIVSFLMDLKHNELLVNCSSLLPFLDIKPGVESNLTVVDELQKSRENSQQMVHNMIKQKRSVNKSEAAQKETVKENSKDKSIEVKTSDAKSTANETDTPPPETFTTSAAHLKTCSSFKIPFKSEIIGQRRKITNLMVINVSN
ncbi:uncharacterized protein LOC118201938, partial [Stegodyphus dumicola]|uniref:uncharacterized protein LOC118201938 n=1 Tax=Stegodyphus dumicola TaxID=202533 RepID=UPI0015B221BF